MWTTLSFDYLRRLRHAVGVRKRLLPVSATVVLLAAGGGCVEQEHPRRRAERPQTARGVVLVLASGFSSSGARAVSPAFLRFAESGRRFDRAFATVPDAGASRATVLEGLPEAFRASGATVASVGPVLPGGSQGAFAWDLSLPGPLTDADVRLRLEKWLSARPAGRFFLVVGADPAVPLSITPEPASLLRRPPLPRIASADLGLAARPGRVVHPRAWSESARRHAAEAHLERVRIADRALEALRDILTRTVIEADLAVAILGDPRPDLGQHGLLRRRDALFDTTLGVDLVISAPGMSGAGRWTRGVVSNRDVAPTLLDLAGLPANPGLRGRSLVPLLTDPTTGAGGEVLSSVERAAGGLGRSIRTARHRYTEWPDGSEELYDHDTDPHESVNLAARPEPPEIIESLRAALTRKERRRSDDAPERRAVAATASNVLLIIVDDLNTRVGPWGAPVATPNLQRLAERGVRFEHAYVQVAMCSPSRTSFLTGWRPDRTGVWSNLDPSRPDGATPLQEHFGTHGRFTAGIGKIYQQPELFRWDFRDGPAHDPPTRTQTRDPGTKNKKPWLKADGDDATQPDGIRARTAARLLRQRRGRPFFAAVGFVRPHRKWIAPARYFDLYPPEEVAVDHLAEADLQNVPAIAVKNRRQLLPGTSLKGREPAGLVREPSLQRELIAAYQACVSFVDAQVGVLLEALDETGLWEDTVVVLIGDNGFHLGEHGGLFKKDTLFEEALRVPLIIAAPGLAHPGSVVTAPVALLDLYPTIVDLAGLPPVSGLDGRSLRPLLEDPEAAGWSAAVSYRRVRSPRRGWSLRTDRMRYTLWPDGSEELYDHGTDPGEQSNLAARTDHEALKARLRLRLEELVTMGNAEPEAGRKAKPTPFEG